MNYEKFFNDHYGKIRSFIFKMVLDWDDASDLTQDTFVSFFLVDKKGKVMNGDINYLYMCARNKVYTFFNRTQRKNMIYDKYADLDHVIIDDSHIEYENKMQDEYRLEMIYEELNTGRSSKGKEIAKKYYFEGLEPEEIAQEFGILPHSVYTAKNRVVDELRKKFCN